ncbi:hypothetical protein BDB01DRAFT_833160 [Pilobolus umbonatus]|nr:hypothetical protein BDB01DRAFT_833160 [Pilobolus umbonatus]
MISTLFSPFNSTIDWVYRWYSNGRGRHREGMFIGIDMMICSDRSASIDDKSALYRLFVLTRMTDSAAIHKPVKIHVSMSVSNTGHKDSPLPGNLTHVVMTTISIIYFINYLFSSRLITLTDLSIQIFTMVTLFHGYFG